MKYIGKNYSDFSIIGSVGLYSLKVGDYFIEDTYPEVYVVTDIEGRVIVTHDLTRNEPGVKWNYSVPAYSPCIIKVVPKSD